MLGRDIVDCYQNSTVLKTCQCIRYMHACIYVELYKTRRPNFSTLGLMHRQHTYKQPKVDGAVKCSGTRMCM